MPAVARGDGAGRGRLGRTSTRSRWGSGRARSPACGSASPPPARSRGARRPAAAPGVVAGGPGARDRRRRSRLPLIDARRGELFAALYEGERRGCWPPFVAAPGRGRGARSEGAASPLLAAGDGSIRFRGMLEAAGVGVDARRLRRSTWCAPSHVCRLAGRCPASRPRPSSPTTSENQTPSRNSEMTPTRSISAASPTPTCRR